MSERRKFTRWQINRQAKFKLEQAVEEAFCQVRDINYKGVQVILIKVIKGPFLFLSLGAGFLFGAAVLAHNLFGVAGIMVAAPFGMAGEESSSDASPIEHLDFSKYADYIYGFFKKVRNSSGDIIKIPRNLPRAKRWLSSETIQFARAVTAASRKRLSSGSTLITSRRLGGFTNMAWVFTASISFATVSFLIILWNLGRAITSINSASVSGEITRINLECSSALSILRQAGLLISPETNTLVSITALSIFFFAVGFYFVKHIFPRNAAIFKAGINIFKDLFPAKTKGFFLQTFGKPQFLSERKPVYGVVNLFSVQFDNRFHFLSPPKMNNTIYLLIRQGIMGILLILAFGATVLAHNLFGVVGVMFAAAVIVPFGMVHPNPSNPNGPEEPGVALLDASPNTQQ